ncbi:MAG: hypothetical protein ACYTFO_03830 [Planctomycetota bacterium]|jgi:hypothetical protein
MPREADIFPPTTRSPDQILRIVLRAVCGFERVEEVCQREGISSCSPTPARNGPMIMVTS